MALFVMQQCTLFICSHSNRYKTSSKARPVRVAIAMADSITSYPRFQMVGPSTRRPRALLLQHPLHCGISTFLLHLHHNLFEKHELRVIAMGRSLPVSFLDHFAPLREFLPLNIEYKFAQRIIHVSVEVPNLQKTGSAADYGVGQCRTDLRSYRQACVSEYGKCVRDMFSVNFNKRYLYRRSMRATIPHDHMS